MRRIVVFAFAAALVVGCAHGGRKTEGLVGAGGGATARAGTGLGPTEAPYAWSILKQRCQNCHVLPDPRKHTRAKWVRGITMMERKLKLSAADWDSLLALVPEPPEPAPPGSMPIERIPAAPDSNR